MKRQPGFTLIEILIALVILAIVGAITMIGLHSAIGIQQRIRKHAERLAEVQSAIIIMERDIAQIINRPVLDVDGSLLPAVMVKYPGDKLQLEFTRAGFINPFSIENRSTLQRISYAWDGQTLWRNVWQSLDRVTREKPEAQLLLTGVSAFSIQFLDSNRSLSQPGETPVLPNQQQQQPLMPLAIEINLVVNQTGNITRLIPLSG